MNDPHDDHESAIKTPKQLIVAVLAAFIIPIIGIIMLVQYVSSEKQVGAGITPEQVLADTNTRISPVADQGFTLKDVNAPKVLRTGEAIYKETCAGCHAAGAAGSPKVGDAGSWSARIAQGYDKLLANAVNGIRGMPAKGGNPDLDDADMARVVVYMANQSGGKFKEPEVKAAAAAPAK